MKQDQLVLCDYKSDTKRLFLNWGQTWVGLSGSVVGRAPDLSAWRQRSLLGSFQLEAN